MTRGVVVLGSTGSIGTQALDVISRHRDDYRVVALAAGRNTELLAEQAARVRRAGRPGARSCVDDPGVLAELAAHPDADVVLNAVVGFAGLPATLGALEAGKRLALANKESLIAAGPVVAKARAAGGGEIVPVDSEHSAIWQCLRAGRSTEVGRIVAHRERRSVPGPDRGGAARRSRSPTRSRTRRGTMGAKITIDSSTLMNKGLEVIEAHELFGVDFDRIDVVVHPQSIVHSMVEFCDGATIAQLSMPDMRLPIGLALGAPDRLPEAFGAIDWSTLGTLDLRAARPRRRSGASRSPTRRAGPAAPRRRSSSAANEVAVEAFLAERIAWTGIAEIVEEVLNAGAGNADEIADVLAADRRRPGAGRGHSCRPKECRVRRIRSRR